MGYSNSARFPKKSPALLRRDYAVLAPVSRSYPPQLGIFPCVTHPSAARRQGCKHPRAAARLACVKRAASVQSEPGSNSYVCLEFFSGVVYFSMWRDYSRPQDLRDADDYCLVRRPRILAAFKIIVKDHKGDAKKHNTSVAIIHFWQKETERLSLCGK